jgi:hypothetical protein
MSDLEYKVRCTLISTGQSFDFNLDVEVDKTQQSSTNIPTLIKELKEASATTDILNLASLYNKTELDETSKKTI